MHLSAPEFSLSLNSILPSHFFAIFSSNRMIASNGYFCIAFVLINRDNDDFD